MIAIAVGDIASNKRERGKRKKPTGEELRGRDLRDRRGREFYRKEKLIERDS